VTRCSEDAADNFRLLSPRTRSPVQWVSVARHPGLSDRDGKLTAYLHRVQMLRVNGAVPSLADVLLLRAQEQIYLLRLLFICDLGTHVYRTEALIIELTTWALICPLENLLWLSKL